MTVRKATRRGLPRLVIDIVFTKPDGTQGRYRKDAQVQTMAAARAEERRLLSLLAQYGEPFEPSETPEPPVAEKASKRGRAGAQVRPALAGSVLRCVMRSRKRAAHATVGHRESDRNDQKGSWS